MQSSKALTHLCSNDIGPDTFLKSSAGPLHTYVLLSVIITSVVESVDKEGFAFLIGFVMMVCNFDLFRHCSL